MIEIKGNLFDWIGVADAICITTNGFVKNNGTCVMGAGVAKCARDLWKGCDYDLGMALKINGNIVQKFCHAEGTDVIAFPTKHVWWEKSDISLIETSCKQLVEISKDYKIVILPKPGCSNGKLSYADVRPVLQKHLKENKFVIIDKE